MKVQCWDLPQGCVLLVDAQLPCIVHACPNRCLAPQTGNLDHRSSAFSTYSLVSTTFCILSWCCIPLNWSKTLVLFNFFFLNHHDLNGRPSGIPYSIRLKYDLINGVEQAGPNFLFDYQPIVPLTHGCHKSFSKNFSWLKERYAWFMISW